MSRRSIDCFVGVLATLAFAWSYTLPVNAAQPKEKPKCGELVTKAQLEKVLGQKVKFDEKAKPVCRIQAQKMLQGNGSIQVFLDGAKSYRQMLDGAKAQFKEKLKETKDVGKKSFQVEAKQFGIKIQEIGFLDKSGRYAVLVSLGVGWAEPDKVLELAKIVDTNLGKH